jgi:hypothetical protein
LVGEALADDTAKDAVGASAVIHAASLAVRVVSQFENNWD